jgi:hypothetical protein
MRSTFEPGENTDEKSNEAGRIPTTSVAWLFRVMARPGIAGSAWKRRCQQACVSRTALGPFHWHSSQGMEKQRVHHAKDGGVRTDPERGGEHGQARKTGAPAQLPCPKPDVLSQLLHPARAPSFTHPVHATPVPAALRTRLITFSGPNGCLQLSRSTSARP